MGPRHGRVGRKARGPGGAHFQRCPRSDDRGAVRPVPCRPGGDAAALRGEPAAPGLARRGGGLRVFRRGCRRVARSPVRSRLGRRVRRLGRPPARARHVAHGAAPGREAAPVAHHHAAAGAGAEAPGETGRRGGDPPAHGRQCRESRPRLPRRHDRRLWRLGAGTAGDRGPADRRPARRAVDARPGGVLFHRHPARVRPGRGGGGSAGHGRAALGRVRYRRGRGGGRGRPAVRLRPRRPFLRSGHAGRLGGAGRCRLRGP